MAMSPSVYASATGSKDSSVNRMHRLGVGGIPFSLPLVGRAEQKTSIKTACVANRTNTVTG